VKISPLIRRPGSVADQDAGPQVPDHRPPGLPPLPRRARHRARPAPWPAGQEQSQHRAPCRLSEPPNCPVPAGAAG